MSKNDTTVDAGNNYENNLLHFSQSSSALCLRPPKHLESSLVLILKQWKESKHEYTLKVGSVGQKVRQKWMS